MGDVNKEVDTDNDPSFEPKKKNFFIWPILLLIIIVLLVVVVKLDIGKISSKYVAPKIKDVPIINKILPKSDEQSLYDDYTDKQFIDTISRNELELEAAHQEIEKQSLQIVDLEKKIDDLQVFEDEYLKFKEEKRIVDESIGMMNQEEFTQFYQQMYPENAKEVYAQIVQVQQMTKEQRKHASLISEMDETSAAKVLEQLFQTDIDIILAILSNMETESASAILQEMNPEIASTIVKQLSPE